MFISIINLVMSTNTSNIQTNTPSVSTSSKKRTTKQKKKIAEEPIYCTDCQENPDRPSKIVLCDKHYYEKR